MVGKQNGTFCNPDGGLPEEDVVGKHDGVVRIGSRMWPQECQLCGLVEENGGIPTVTLIKIMAAAVVTLAGGVPEEDVVVKQEDVCCNRDVGVPEEDEK